MKPVDDLIKGVNIRRQEIIDLCLQLIRLPSPNPPGDTQEVANYIQKYLENNGLPVELENGRSSSPNLISSVSHDKPGPHLVLLTHMDTYPVGDLSQWIYPPFAATIEKGYIIGRGAGDMKAGLACMLFAFSFMSKQAMLPGRLTLLSVSDELTFSAFGAPRVLDRHPEVFGDAVLGCEPTEPDQILFGEKGMVWIEVSCHAKSGHGAYVAQMKNANQTMIEILQKINTLHGRQVTLPDNVTRPMKTSWPMGGLRLEEVEKLVQQVTVNIGVIKGGRKINMIADQCQAQVDIRIPPGMLCQEVVDFLDKLFQGVPTASYNIIQSCEPTWSDTDHLLFQVLRQNVTKITGLPCRFEIGLPASDGRLFAHHKIPVALYGPYAIQEGGPNEAVAIENVIDSTKVLLMTISKYFEMVG